MGAPNSGPSGKKFTNSDVLAAFNEENRRRVGKIELTVKEVTEILNEKILPDGTTVTRQAVDNRLNKLVGDKLVRSKHGRSYLYRRPDDIERLFSEPTHTSAPAGGGAPPNERGKEFQMSSTSFLANLGNNQTVLAGVFVMILGTFLVASPLFLAVQPIQSVFFGIFVLLLGAFTIAISAVAQLAQMTESADNASPNIAQEGKDA